MHPVLLTFGEFEIRSYSFFYALSCIVMFILALKRAPRFNVPRNTMLNASILTGISMLVGARLWYGVLDRYRFSGRWTELVNPFHQGSVGYSGGWASVGGVTLVALVVYVYTRWSKQNYLTIADAGTPGFLLSSAIARIGGCFLAGCCFGKPTDSVFGVVFPPEGHLSPFPLGTPLWPTQLFYAALEIIGFAVVLWVERRFYSPGSTFIMVVVYYAVDRFLVEQFRYYPPSQILGHVGPFIINLNHPLLVGVVIFSLVLWLRNRRTRYQIQEGEKQ